MSIRLLLLVRQLTAHPLQTALGVLGIALSVAIVLAIDLVNASAERAFDLSRQSLFGTVTHRIRGNGEIFGEEVYLALRRDFRLQQSFPVVTGSLQTEHGEEIQVTGIDPVALMGTTGSRLVPGQGLPFIKLLEPDTAMLSSETMQRLRLDSSLEGPDELGMLVHDGVRTLNIVGTWSTTNHLGDDAFADGVITDISTAQELLGLTGSLSSIELVLKQEQQDEVKSILPPGVHLVDVKAWGSAMDQMTRAFRTNLTALSLLALLIGAFLIYNTMTLSVLRRRGAIATLRTIGLTRGELFFSVICEAAALALAGIMVGTLLGLVLSHQLLALASRTIEDLYYMQEVRALHIEPLSFFKAYGLGLVVSILASLQPAREAARIPPELSRSRSRLESATVGHHTSLMLCAAGCAVVATALLLFSGQSIVAGFAGLFFVAMAGALLIPILMKVLVRLVGNPLKWLLGTSGTVACRGVIASLSRTQVAVTALAIAISATIAVSIMISSFRVSVDQWLHSYLRADIYIAQIENRDGAGLPPALIDQVSRLPQISDTHTIRWRSLMQDGALVALYVIDVQETHFDNYQFIDRISGNLWDRFCCTRGVIISEPYAFHQGHKIGDQVRLPTDNGEQSFDVLGIYRDYLSDRGIVTMHRDTYMTDWQDPVVLSLAVYMNDSTSAEEGANVLTDELREFGDIRIRSAATIRQMALAIFDRTFAITEVLRILTIVIAVIGILGALTAIQAERGAEFAILRITGVTTSGLGRLIMTESGIMGLIAGILSIPVGIVMAWVIIAVINRRSFGWSMEMLVEPRYLLLALMLGLGAGVAAGILPAWSISRNSLASQLRYES